MECDYEYYDRMSLFLKYFFAEIILKKNMDMILCSIPVLRDEGGTRQPSVSPFLLLGVNLPFSCTKSSMGIAISNTLGGCEWNDRGC